jgi:hypothetical protein
MQLKAGKSTEQAFLQGRCTNGQRAHKEASAPLALVDMQVRSRQIPLHTPRMAGMKTTVKVLDPHTLPLGCEMQQPLGEKVH